MRRKESNKTPRARGCALKAALLCIPVAAILCGGCTRKEELVFSLQETQREEEAAAEESDTGLGAGAETGDNAGAAQSGTASGVEGTDAVSDGVGAEEADSRTEPAVICIHVCGAVQEPGVYELPAGSRVYQAVQAAGGFTEDADRTYVNQAQQLPDEVQLMIPTIAQVEALAQEDGDTEGGAAAVEAQGRIGILFPESSIQADGSGAAEEESGVSAEGKININTASESQLCEIPGIGAARASAIIAYRQEHGAFAAVEDIMNVSGIKQGTYDKIKDSITTG
ncbi:MAG: helix-hairpin-helix domain-containing protein [Clostridiales bacterium]|nr:helix-hairpin-helix domain-containing protein [Clostridiales bacterium]